MCDVCDATHALELGEAYLAVLVRVRLLDGLLRNLLQLRLGQIVTNQLAQHLHARHATCLQSAWAHRGKVLGVDEAVVVDIVDTEHDCTG